MRRAVGEIYHRQLVRQSLARSVPLCPRMRYDGSLFSEPRRIGMATPTSPPDKPPGGEVKPGNGEATQAQDVELLKVVVTRDGQKVSAQWAIHPQIKHDLLPEEWKEISDLMVQVTGIVGTRFSEILSEAEPDKPGTA